MHPVTYEELKQIVQENGQLSGWDFSQINTGRDPVPWVYPQVVRSWLQPSDHVLDIGTGGGEIFLSLAPYFGSALARRHPARKALAKHQPNPGKNDNQLWYRDQ